MSRPAPSRGPAGFTLVEMVVALALAGLVSIVLLQGLRLTATGFDRVTRAADRLDARAGLEALLRRALSAASPLTAVGGTPAFVGAPERMSFVAPAEDGGAGLYRIELALAGGEASRELVLTRRLAVPFAATREQQSVVAAGLRGLRLAYFGAVAPGEAPGWHDRWDGIAYPPQLVRITLDDGAPGAQPPIVIRLWASG